MAKTSSLNIRLDPEIKSAADSVFSRFGITLADAVNIFLHKSIMVGGLPFDMLQPRYNVETETAMKEADDIIAGRIQAKRYSSFKEFAADMENEDAGV
jgi:DNA-damage-inducible protein J